MTENQINALWENPANWRWTFIYYCKDDPRIIVPKRSRILGWTMNFAHRRAIPTLALIIIAIIAPFEILRLSDIPMALSNFAITVGLVLIGLFLFCYIMASPKRYADKTNPYQNPASDE